MPRGPLSEVILGVLRRPPERRARIPDRIGARPADPLTDDDFHLALYACYELHYRGFGGVDAGWEWDPSLLTWRARFEGWFEDALGETDSPRIQGPARSVQEELGGLARGVDGPSLSAYMAARGTREQMAEMCIHRSAYQLKEADPHTWVLPRLTAGPKAAAMAIQFEEYGSGHAGRMHSELFARTMRALDLDDDYGAYLDVIPGVTLATVNLMSMLGLHRRHRARLVGHLALFEMTSVEPMSRYGNALRRLGIAPEADDFFQAHVVADESHARTALTTMVGSLLGEEPELAPEVVQGAGWLVGTEGRFARHLLGCWERGATSLSTARGEAA